MSQPSHQPDLPQQIAQDLRALGGVQAPSELWQRVQEERSFTELGEVAAPEELWARVQAELGMEVAAPQGRLLRGIFGGKSLAAAAALLIFGGLSIFNPWSSPSGLSQDFVVLAPQTSESAREAFRSRAQFQKVTPQEMSSISRGLAGSLGGFMVEDDA
ncbi:MAG: hypothetical protein O3A95_02040 [Planctomycetota bacterium]|nr:hypothetical protein [Planctomycetota bacterium]MDA1113064.1 hypothetical protein [Planctomycetota bacterium]